MGKKDLEIIQRVEDNKLELGYWVNKVDWFPLYEISVYDAIDLVAEGKVTTNLLMINELAEGRLKPGEDLLNG